MDDFCPYCNASVSKSVFDCSACGAEHPTWLCTEPVPVLLTLIGGAMLWVMYGPALFITSVLGGREDAPFALAGLVVTVIGYLIGRKYIEFVETRAWVKEN